MYKTIKTLWVCTVGADFQVRHKQFRDSKNVRVTYPGDALAGSLFDEIILDGFNLETCSSKEAEWFHCCARTCLPPGGTIKKLFGVTS